MSGYTKLFQSILESTIWLETPPVKVVWITMLAMADRDGIVEASVPGLAKRAGVDREQCEQALALFLAPDHDSRTKDHEGRRIQAVPGGWRLINYDLHRARASAEEAKEKATARQRRHRLMLQKRDAALRSVTGVTSDGSNDIAEAPPPPPQESTRTRSLIAKRRKDAAWEGPRVYVPQRLHSDLVALRNGQEADLLEWYAAVSDQWSEGGSCEQEEPGADMFAFWRARYAERWPAKMTARRATEPMPTRGAWRDECERRGHVPACSIPEHCILKHEIFKAGCRHVGVCQTFAECQRKKGEG
jgi:hypothetical protein